MTPYPKPEKKVKQPKPIKKVSTKDEYTCSDGRKVSQAYINSMLSKSYAKGLENSICEACGSCKAEGHSHIVKQKTLKDLHLTDLIWSPQMYTYECHGCNSAWDSAIPEIEDHKNIVKKMVILWVYDKQAFYKRFDKFSNFKVMDSINTIKGE
jgi:hypothetical protein